MSNIKVSVIIPTYNRSGMLIKALDSLQLQDYPSHLYEVVVVDNNSKDNTCAVIKKYIEDFNDRLNVKYTIENRQGDIYARHTGAYYSEGEILIFTDDDATFDVNWISEIVDFFHANPTLGAVGTRIVIKWNEEPSSWVKNYESLLGKISYGDNRIVQETGLFINNGSLAIKKNIFYEVKGNNPGQLKSFLIGDAEVGLCRKLHDKKISIGFTDLTTMWHHQIVNVNGTFKDIKRRVANNGIAQAYTDCIVEKKTTRFFLYKSFLIQILIVLKSFLNFKRKSILNSILQLHQLRYRYMYNKNYKTDTNLLQLINRNDWFFDENYKGSNLIINHKIKTT